ncbi:hypothetical protein SLE2022_011680 [Rubroshorea leprosula]
MQLYKECLEIVLGNLNLIQKHGITSRHNNNISIGEELNGFKGVNEIGLIKDNNDGLLEYEKFGPVDQVANKVESDTGLILENFATKPVPRDQQEETTEKPIQSKEPLEKSFWERIDSDSRRLADWMVKGERKRQKKRARRQAKKVRLCIKVFKQSRPYSKAKMSKKGK